MFSLYSKLQLVNWEFSESYGLYRMAAALNVVPGGASSSKM